MLDRRQVLQLLGAAAASPLLACSADAAAPRAAATGARLPVIFVAHGAPPLLDDAGWVAELGAWGKALPRPRALLVISAHWEQRPATLGATRPVPLVYDFYGFPERYYRMRYPSPGAPELASRVHGLLAARGIACVSADDRGLDHGAYVPLMCMWPAADLPVLQLSLPGLEPQELFRLGVALAPLRDEGVLVIGSGFLTHNLRARYRTRAADGTPATPAWASEFDSWIAEVLSARDLDRLVDYRARAPALRLAHPTEEHLSPVVVAAGAASTSASSMTVTYPITGFWHGTFTRRSVELG
jgi:4,5-DOPA dioxygenase extradiol